MPGLYEGEWDALRYFDYVYFPMAWFLHGGEAEIVGECDSQACLAQHNLTLVLGVQDRAAALVTLNLAKLVSTMKQL